MLGYLIRAREMKSSKRVVIKDVNCEETEYLINIDDINTLQLNKVVEFETGERYRNMLIVTSIKALSEEEMEEGSEAKLLNDMFSPKPVPKIKQVMDDIINFVNETPDQSNICGEARHLEFEDFKVALKNYFTDMEFDSESGELKPVSRLNDFLISPASTIYHDSQRGGLLRHTAKLISMIIESYKCKYQTFEVHPLTLMVGALVHDAGKIDQYVENNNAYELTEWYKYRGSHIGMGLERWSRNGRQFLIDIKVDARDINKMFWDIFHIIGSHHGPVKSEYGSFWDPFGHDASTIYGLDYVESHMEETIKPTRTE